MKAKNVVLKILSAFITVVFLYSSVAWSAPDLCLRQRSILERNILLDPKIQKAKEDLAKLNTIAEGEAQKLENIRARITQEPTVANKEFFGLVAERLMLVLTEMQVIKDWIAGQDYNSPRRNVNWGDYESNIPYPSDPQKDIITDYELFPEGAIVPASAAAGNGRTRAKKTVSVLMAG